jgi:chromosome segregation ATPase
MMNSLLQQLSLAQSASAPKGFKSSANAASAADSSTMLSGLLGSNKKTMEKISELKKENQELKSLEKLRPQLLDLQQQLTNLQSKYSEQQSFYHQELEMLTDHNEQLSHGITGLKLELDEKVEEVRQNVIMIKQLTERNKYLESESRQLLIDLDDAKYEIEQVRIGSVDPVAMDELQKKIEQLEGPVLSSFPSLPPSS